MKITKHKYKGDILIEFKKFIVWFYPNRHMNISHMKPKTLIKGFCLSLRVSERLT